jgi:hypothetical protein
MSRNTIVLQPLVMASEDHWESRAHAGPRLVDGIKKTSVVSSTIDVPGTVSAIAFSPDGATVAVGHDL